MSDDEFTDDGLSETLVAQARDRLSVRMNALVNPLAGRDDLLLTLIWKDPSLGEAPAWFDPQTGWVTVNGAVALGETDPDEVEPRTPAGRAAHPEIVGLLCHEASHAHSTQWGKDGFGKDLSPSVRKAAVLLEEPRIERRQLERRPQDRPYLRAQSALIDLKPFAKKEEGEIEKSLSMNRWRAATLALLILGRVDAGVLDAEDALRIRPLLEKALGEILFDLQDIWRRALHVEDGDIESLVSLGQEWVEVLGEAPEDFSSEDGSCAQESSEDGASSDGGESSEGDEGEGEAGDGAASTEGEGSEGEESEGEDGSADGDGTPTEEQGDGEGKSQQGNESDPEGAEGDADKSDDEAVSGSQESDESVSEEEWLEAIQDGLEHAAAEARDEIAHAMMPVPSAADAHRQNMMQMKEDHDQQEKAAKASKAIFHGYSNTRGGSAIRGTRPPLPQERRLARELGETLKRAQFRERTKTKVRSEVPPGRMDGREVMQAQAQRARRQMVTARPFTAVVRRRVPEPPVTLGTMVDVSGSMSWATEVIATTAWAFSHAVYSIRGRSACVAFGDSVIPVTEPGMPPKDVTTFTARAGTEKFAKGFAALDGALNLTMGQGVRILVVVSDGMLVGPGELKAAQDAVARLSRNGALVLWIGMPGSHVPPGAIAVEIGGRDGLSLSDIPLAIGEALTEALRTR